MHHTKRAARSLAWSDPNNPFAKRWAIKGPTDPLMQAENGDSALFRHSTDDPSDYSRQRTLTEQSQGWDTGSSSRHAATVPTAVSRRRNNEAGDHVEPIPMTSSPPASIKDKTIAEEPRYDEKSAPMVNGNTSSSTDRSLDPDNSKHHHGKKFGWFKRSSSDKEKEQEDNDNSKTKKPKKHFTPMSQIRATLLNSWINVLLIFSPIGIVLGNVAGISPIAVFVVNFVAIIPLAAMLSYATEEIALRTGEVIGGLLNATFGNAVELIVSIIALIEDQVLIVQTSLIGSMLSNLLLVMGMCFFAGGVNRIEQAFNITVAQTASALLFLAISALIIPTVFQLFANNGASAGGPLVSGEAELSRGTAVLLLLVYAAYLFFQLKSHSKMYLRASEKNDKRDFSKQKDKMKKMVPSKLRRRSMETGSDKDSNDGEEEAEEPQLALWVAIATLGISTALVAVNAEYLVGSINAITCGGGISKNFVGLILLPIVGNAAEHATAVTVAIKDKMDLAIGVAVGSSIQIALLVLPLIVILGWIIGKNDMTLYFDGFQIAVLFVAILLVNYLIQDGKSHWLEGVLLMILYITIAVAAWFYPTLPGLSDCPGQ